MKYMGSKSKIAKEILPIILKDRKEDQWYVEPFVGGCNIIDKVTGPRIGSDNNFDLISMWKALASGNWRPPQLVTEDIYNELKKYHPNHNRALRGYVGFALSFGGKWFGGYRRDKKGSKGCVKNMCVQSLRAYNSMMKQIPLIQDVHFVCSHYHHLELPDNCIIYCDPPYENATKYKDYFDHNDFWDWCRTMKEKGHKIFISEYNAPNDFKCIWEKKISSGLAKKERTERLFTL